MDSGPMMSRRVCFFRIYGAVHRDHFGTSRLLHALTESSFAGSETTATTLTVSIWYVCTNAVLYKRLCDEVRGSVTSYSQICNAQAAKLEFLHAVLLEALRMYPPVPFGLPRSCVDDVTFIDGRQIPKGVSPPSICNESSLLTRAIDHRQYTSVRRINA